VTRRDHKGPLLSTVLTIGAKEDSAVAVVSPASHSYPLTRTLCLVIVLIMVAAVIYAGWIGILNFSRIGV
jgi:hypothetical protein